MNSGPVPMYWIRPGACVISNANRTRIGPGTFFISRATDRIVLSY